MLSGAMISGLGTQSEPTRPEAKKGFEVRDGLTGKVEQQKKLDGCHSKRGAGSVGDPLEPGSRFGGKDSWGVH
jgi:hypothetical protein